jgi:putative flippase GtrA
MSEVSRILKYALVGGIIGIVVESILASLTFVCSSNPY